MVKIISTSILGAWLLLSTCQQKIDQLSRTEDRHVGGGCEGCEATLEYDPGRISAIDSLPDTGTDAPLLKVTGSVYHNDGLTPAPDVVIYMYHTDLNGDYLIRNSVENGLSLNARNKGLWADKHGSYRGWVRTDEDGRYTFFTQRPGHYSGLKDPAHIHMFVKEPGVAPYYIDDLLFADDTLLSAHVIESQTERGGTGIVKPVEENDKWVVERNVILGMNIPGY